MEKGETMSIKHANTKWTPDGWVFDPIGARKDFSKAYRDDHVIRWTSNDRVPFDDMLFDFLTLGLIDRQEFEMSNQCQKNEARVSIAKYREAMKNHVPTGEELFEMRAAFGEGETVINVITGKKTKL